MLPDKNEQQLLHELLLENQHLLTENNQLLKKMNRRSVLSFWFRLLKSLVIIGALVFLYFHFVEPYIASIEPSFQEFQAGLQEVPGWRQFYEAVGGKVSSGE